MALATLTFARSSSLTLPSCTQLRNKPRLFIFAERASDLAHHLTRWVDTVRKVIAVCGQNAHAALDQSQDAQLLRDQLACEARCVLDYDCANAIALNAIEQP